MKLKKLLIGIILALAFTIILCLSLVVKNKFYLKVADSVENNAIDELETKEDIEENIIQENEIIKDESAEIINTPVVEQIQKEIPTVAVIQDKVSSSKKSTQTTNSSQDITTSQETKPQEQPKPQPKTETVIPTKQEEPKVTEEKKETIYETPNTSIVPKMETKYIRNDDMINKIRNVINSNPSEYMKTYGYEIVVDSSIKELTNQFTFTENRVKGYITNTFGTIRIYAEDYYVNGELLMTECYIL